jgi:ribosomal protein S18 acetylase RimI-like enzyme
MAGPDRRYVIRDYDSADFGAVRAMLVAAGWGGRAEDPDRLRRIIDAATRAVVAVADEEVVGFARCLSDGVSDGYLSMVIVAPSHRRRGLGTALVTELIGEDDRLTWVLRAGHPGSEGFWSGIGFRRSEIAFERPRRR